MVGRPRSTRCDTAIVDATLDLLGECGFGGLSIDAVAVRAGVGKASIYRRWSSKPELVYDALSGCVEPIPEVDTGSLHDDLQEFLRRMARGLTSSRVAPLLPSLIEAAERDPDVAAVLARFAADRRASLRRLFERAATRGELADGADIELLVDVTAGTLFYRKLLLRHRLDPAYTDRVADAVLTLAAAPARPRSPRRRRATIR